MAFLGPIIWNGKEFMKVGKGFITNNKTTPCYVVMMKVQNILCHFSNMGTYANKQGKTAAFILALSFSDANNGWCTMAWMRLIFGLIDQNCSYGNHSAFPLLSPQKHSPKRTKRETNLHKFQFSNLKAQISMLK